jgi:hypothetical protein
VGEVKEGGSMGGAFAEDQFVKCTDIPGGGKMECLEDAG